MFVRYRLLCYWCSILFLYAVQSFSAPPVVQNKNMIDSLKNELTKTQGEKRVSVLNELSWEYRTFDQNKAIEYGLQALGLAEQLQFKIGVVRALNNLGIVYRRRGNYPQALDYHLKALKISEDIQDSADIGQALNRIGLIYQGQANYNAALEYFQRARIMYEKTHNLLGVGKAMTNIGEIYSRQGKYSLALEYLVKSQAIHEETTYRDGIAEAGLEIGLVYGKQGNTQLGMEYLQKALKLYEQIGNKSGVAQTLSILASMLLQMGELDEAERFANTSLGFAREVGEIEWMKQASRTLSGIFTQRQNYKKALDYQLLYTTLKDSVTGEESVRKIADLETMLATEKRQAQIELLTKENEIQQLIRNSLAVGLVLVFVLAYVLFRSNHQQMKANRLLSEQNAEILRQQKMLEEQAGEIQLANTELQEANISLQRQQKILSEQTLEIELANSELLELNINLEAKQKTLEEQAEQIEQANAELQAGNTQLNEANEQLNEFLGIAAHDLKNPLSSVVMSASAIKRYYDRMSKEDILDMVSNVEVTAERMRLIIHNLLELNSIESGKLNLAAEPVSPGEILENVVQDWQPKAANKNIVVHFDNQAPEKFITGDPNILHQILENLVSNAVKYSPSAKNVWVRIISSEISAFAGQQNASASQQYVRVEVQDEGPGISAEDKAKLFGKFAKLTAQPTAGEHSTGLGLSIVKRLVEAMNGRVWCESKLGKGATFIVEFSVSVA
jgi:signal transduction histidine kinase